MSVNTCTDCNELVPHCRCGLFIRRTMMTTEDHAAGTGPPGTYGCACVSRDARNCALLRYGWCGNFGAVNEPCECLCHEWEDHDDDVG